VTEIRFRSECGAKTTGTGALVKEARGYRPQRQRRSQQIVFSCGRQGAILVPADKSGDAMAAQAKTARGRAEEFCRRYGLRVPILMARS
jgi:hypothetical protein